MQSSKTEKNAKKRTIIILIVGVIVILMVIGILGFRDGGWFRSQSYDAQYVQSLWDYAKQLEEAGNSEAAAAVYELIVKNGGGELIREANEELPVVQANNEMEQFKRFMSGSKAGDNR